MLDDLVEKKEGNKLVGEVWEVIEEVSVDEYVLVKVEN